MSKEYAVKCSAMVAAGKTFESEDFQKFIQVVSPKTGRELRDVRLDYLSAENAYQPGPEAASREQTLQKILKGFQNPTRTPRKDLSLYGKYDRLEVTIMMTAKDLQNIFNAWGEWQIRQMDYAD
jgi:hypothetical protein